MGINNNHIDLEDIKKLTDLSEQLLQIGNRDIDYQRITDDISKISGAKYTCFNLFDEAGLNYSTVAMCGNSKIIDMVIDKIGYGIKNRQWPLMGSHAQATWMEPITRFNRLADLIDTYMPRQTVLVLEKIVRCGEIALVKILKSNIILGEFIFFMPENQKFIKEEVVGLYSKQVGMVITRHRAEIDTARKDWLLNEAQVIGNMGNWELDLKTKKIKASRQAFVIYGLPVKDELSLDLVQESVFSEYRKLLDITLKQLITKTGDYNVEFMIKRKDNGEERYIKSKAELYCDDLGNPEKVVGVITDITDNKKAEEMLQIANDRFNQLAEQNRTVAWEVNADGLYTYISPVVKLILGYDPEELENRYYFYDLHPEKGREEYKNSALEVFSHKEEFVNFLNQAVSKQGGIVWLSTNGIPLLDENENLVGYRGSDIDVTEKKLIDDRLRFNEEKYRLIAENTSDVIMVVNLTTNEISYLSPSVLQISGFSAEEASKMKFEEYIHPDSLKKYNKHIKENLNRFISNPNLIFDDIIEIQMICKNGNVIWIEISSKYRYNKNNEIEVLKVIRNINARKVQEAKKEYDSYHDELTGLFNRKHFEEKLIEKNSHKGVFTIIVGDLNGLKEINDFYGNNTGDCILQQVADIIFSACGDKGEISRIGGDEFACLLYDITYSQAFLIISDIKKRCKKESGEMEFGISFGIATNADENLAIVDCYNLAENRMYTSKLLEGKSSKSRLLDNLSSVLEERSGETHKHCDRIARHAMLIADELNLVNYETENLRLLSLLHDIGKTAIPDSILIKPGKLLVNETEIMRTHCEIGARIASTIPELSIVAQGIISHHEQWDGNGYPKGLKGEEIPLISRIITLLDAYDAMINDRPYRDAMSMEYAVQEIRRCSGKQFDPVIAKVFVEKILKQKWE